MTFSESIVYCNAMAKLHGCFREEATLFIEMTIIIIIAINSNSFN